MCNVNSSKPSTPNPWNVLCTQPNGYGRRKYIYIYLMQCCCDDYVFMRYVGACMEDSTWFDPGSCTCTAFCRCLRLDLQRWLLWVDAFDMHDCALSWVWHLWLKSTCLPLSTSSTSPPSYCKGACVIRGYYVLCATLTVNPQPPTLECMHAARWVSMEESTCFDSVSSPLACYCKGTYVVEVIMCVSIYCELRTKDDIAIAWTAWTRRLSSCCCWLTLLLMLLLLSVIVNILLLLMHVAVTNAAPSKHTHAYTAPSMYTHLLFKLFLLLLFTL